MPEKIKAFLKSETVLCIAALCAVISMFFVPPDEAYLHYIDFRVLCLLLCLMAVVAGFKKLGAFDTLTSQLLQKIKNGRTLSAALVLLPFFCSMAVTNDVALIVFIPFTLGLLSQLGCNNAAIPMCVLQTVAANLGSMATPVGNPQNLYLYSEFALLPADFFSVVLPLTAISLLCLTAASFPVLPKALPQTHLHCTEKGSGKTYLLYGVLFLLCLLTVFRVVPYPVTTGIVVAVIFVTDRKLLKEIDFMLLLTFVCFFVVSENLGRLEIVRTFLQTLLEKNALLTAIGASQVISNVPAAILLSGFTDNWKALLAGTNIGGLGTPIASLASLITLKLYLRAPHVKPGKFLLVFTAANIIGLCILISLGLLII